MRSACDPALWLTNDYKKMLLSREIRRRCGVYVTRNLRCWMERKNLRFVCSFIRRVLEWNLYGDRFLCVAHWTFDSLIMPLVYVPMIVYGINHEMSGFEYIFVSVRIWISSLLCVWLVQFANISRFLCVSRLIVCDVKKYFRDFFSVGIR